LQDQSFFAQRGLRQDYKWQESGRGALRRCRQQNEQISRRLGMADDCGANFGCHTRGLTSRANAPPIATVPAFSFSSSALQFVYVGGSDIIFTCWHDLVSG
jgi:hypothetical protein